MRASREIEAKRRRFLKTGIDTNAKGKGKGKGGNGSMSMSKGKGGGEKEVVEPASDVPSTVPSESFAELT